MSKNFKRFLSVVLILILCISHSAFPAYAVEKADKLNELSSGELNEVDKEDIIEATETEKLVVSDTFISYIDKSEFESHNFTRRLLEQEKLNTYVFQNDDNTRTVYYFDENLKYIDDKGQVVEKDLSIIETDNGYTIKKSDIGVNLPTTPTSGIAVGYNNYSISITPISASKITSLENIKAEKADGSIVYDGVFGSSTKLIYTPILSGLKEDIILSEYVPNTQFSFTIKTNGLSIVENDGQHFLAETVKSEPIFKLGDVIVYDAVGKPSIGSMTVKTVKVSSEYIITLEVDEDFLKDSGTIYPVTIDPSITISDNTNGAGAIEDAPIYEGYPNTNFGTYLFNPVGTPSADFGVGRTAVRLTGLISSTEYTSINASQITNVTFYVKDGSGTNGTAYFVNTHAIISNTNWTESSINWSSAQGYALLPNGGGSLSTGGQWSGLDITELVKLWKSGSYSANGGFIMISANESVNRNFLSSEYSNASYRPYVVMTYDTVISIVPPNVTIVEGNTGTLVATTRPSGQTVTWSTSNSSIATVNSNGVVTAHSAGTATITATTVSSDGVSYSAYCTVCVTIPDGVYYIKNKNSNYYLTTSGAITGTPDVYQFSQYASNIHETIQIRQMWKIKHLGNGLYSVRPYNKLDMGLNVANDNDPLTPDNVNITSIGTTDTLTDVSSSATWKITNAFGGYIFENDATDACMQIASSSTAQNTTAITHFFSMGNNCLWALEEVSSPPAGAYLYDTSKNSIVSDATVYIDVGVTMTLTELGLIAVAYSETDISQSFSWYSTSGIFATVGSNGAVTGISVGESTISGCVYRNNSYYYIGYTIRVGYPSLFNFLIDSNILDISQVEFTDDGMFLTTTPMSTVLVNKGIEHLPTKPNYTKLINVEKHFDDWYIFVVKNNASEACGLFMMREQENDYYINSDGIPNADPDVPGIIISFIELDITKLTNCFENDSNANRYALYQALTKVVGQETHEHNDIIAEYFADTSSDGAYLIAEKSVNFFANTFSGNVISTSDNLSSLFEAIENIKIQMQNMPIDSVDYIALSQYKMDLERIPNALKAINDAVVTPIFNFNNYTITVQNKNNLTLHEKQAILACFSSNVTFNSFAAEVEYHADALYSRLAIFEDWYSRAVRADMFVGEENESGILDKYYDLDSDIVQGQVAAHGEY